MIFFKYLLYFCSLFYGCLFPHYSIATTYPEGDDFATQVLHDPWDMNNEADYYPLRWVDNLSQSKIEKGVFIGTPKNNDPHIWLHFPQIISSIPTLNQKPQDINADKYSILTFYLHVSDDIESGSLEAVGRIVWHFGGDTIEEFNSNIGESALFPVYPGWHLYSIDLKNITPNVGAPWQGIIKGLRIDPCFGCQQFQLDWARLTSKETPLTAIELNQHNSILLIANDTESDNYLTVTHGDGEGHYDLSHLSPGNYQIAAIDNNDYALSQLANPWDMNNENDFFWSSRSGWENPQVSDGMFSGISNNADPFLLLNISPDHPIDANQYRYLHVQMSVSQIPDDEPGLMVFWGTQAATPVFHSDFELLQPGLHTYTIDLNQFPQWSGDIRALRIDPLGGANSTNITVNIQHISLTRTATFSTTLPTLDTLITINSTPQAELLSPSAFTGIDYASSVLQDPWDMDNDHDVQDTRDISNGHFINSIPDLNLSGTFYTGSSVPRSPEGDPGISVLSQQNTFPLNADQFPLLAFSLYVPFDANDPDELGTGAIARVAWKRDDFDNGRTTDDILLFPGLHTYLLDMSTVKYEPASATSWTGQVRYLRIDPHEFGSPRDFYLDTVRVLSYPQSGDLLAVSLDLQDIEQDPLQITLLVDNTPVASYSSITAGIRTLHADISHLIAGAHTLQIQLNDGFNSSEQTLAVPFILDTTDKDTDNDGTLDSQDSDDDNDGMPDDFELAHQLNPLVNDAYDDADKDGSSNITEYQLGTDPNDATLFPDTGNGKLVNLSTRSIIKTGDEVLIAGFIITGGTKKVLITATAPSLTALGVKGALADPQLTLFSGETVIADNDNWKDNDEAAINATGLAPTEDKEAAIMLTLEPGNYTAIVRGVNNQTGIALVNILDLEPDQTTATLSNVSSRSKVQTGDEVMIAGFIIAGGAKKILISTSASSLSHFNIQNALADSQLEIYSGQTLIASNDDWISDNQENIASTPYVPSDNKESAIILTLAAGNYTAIVRGSNQSSGIALINVNVLE